MTERLIILGSGPAGLTAAIYAARADLKPLLIEGGEPGGQLMTTTEVENWPGEPTGIMGPELIDNMRKQAERFGTRFAIGRVKQVDFSSVVGGEHALTLEDGTVMKCHALIIATGATAKWLGIPSEQRLRGKGVSACATCDGFFFKGKEIAVVGGGDSAIEEATFLTKFASKVTLLVRGEAFKASKAMQHRLEKDPKISVLMNTEVAEVLGEQAVTGLQLRDVKTGALTELPVQGLFLAIGHTPNTQLFEGKLDMEKGYLATTGAVATRVPGVFAAGDVADWKYRQAITAAGTGCASALEAERYLATLE